jgi:putative oxidoreductase
MTRLNGVMIRIPSSVITLIGRFSLAAVFWKSGQTKIENFSIDVIDGTFHLGWPRLADATLYLFQEEYALPLLSTEIAAYMATFAEHLLPIMLLVGLGTRFAALGLLGMTLIIQLFVYPDAYAVHGTWAAVLLYLMAMGGVSDPSEGSASYVPAAYVWLITRSAVIWWPKFRHPEHISVCTCKLMRSPRDRSRSSRSESRRVASRHFNMANPPGQTIGVLNRHATVIGRDAESRANYWC